MESLIRALLDYNIPSNNRELQLRYHPKYTHPYYNIPSNNRELQLGLSLWAFALYYNIPSNNRELQRSALSVIRSLYYNIPSNNRELQHNSLVSTSVLNYNIPSNNRELQLWRKSLLQWQNYNIPSNNRELQRFPSIYLKERIITYQVITGNYSYNVLWESSDNILKKYKWKRKSLAITPSDVDIFSQTSETLNGTAFKNIISQSQKNNTLNKRDHI